LPSRRFSPVKSVLSNSQTACDGNTAVDCIFQVGFRLWYVLGSISVMVVEWVMTGERRSRRQVPTNPCSSRPIAKPHTTPPPSSPDHQTQNHFLLLPIATALHSLSFRSHIPGFSQAQTFIECHLSRPTCTCIHNPTSQTRSRPASAPPTSPSPNCTHIHA
jgi:hypothetical protein